VFECTTVNLHFPEVELALACDEYIELKVVDSQGGAGDRPRFYFNKKAPRNTDYDLDYREAFGLGYPSSVEIKAARVIDGMVREVVVSGSYIYYVERDDSNITVLDERYLPDGASCEEVIIASDGSFAVKSNYMNSTATKVSALRIYHQATDSWSLHWNSADPGSTATIEEFIFQSDASGYQAWVLMKPPYREDTDSVFFILQTDTSNPLESGAQFAQYGLKNVQTLTFEWDSEGLQDAPNPERLSFGAMLVPGNHDSPTAWHFGFMAIEQYWPDSESPREKVGVYSSYRMDKSTGAVTQVIPFSYGPSGENWNKDYSSLRFGPDGSFYMMDDTIPEALCTVHGFTRDGQETIPVEVIDGGDDYYYVPEYSVVIGDYLYLALSRRGYLYGATQARIELIRLAL